MDQTVKAEWVAALRSGKYTQGHGYLRNEHNNFCCLGVLCEVAVKHEIIPEPHQSHELGAWHYGPGASDDVYLPDAVKEWAALDQRNPTVLLGEQDVLKLAELNDDGEPFDAIADLIEEHL